MAEDAGFQCISSSDHFHPWSEKQGHSGFSFSWLGAAMLATKLPFSVVCAPGYRYHPAIVAQAAATLSQLFEGRFSIALGSGEALNESITGEEWPDKSMRNQRLRECYEVIQRLLDGEAVDHYGITKTAHARLYTLPQIKPQLIGTAVTLETAAWMGQWADGLLTVHRPYEELKEVVNAFQQNGGTGKPMYLKVQLSYAKTEKAALQGAFDQWRNNVLSPQLLADLPTVEDFDRRGISVTENELRQGVNISADIATHKELVQQYASLGFERIILHNVNRDQETFIKDFGAMLLPYI